MALKLVLLLLALSVRADEDLQDFDFDLGKDEIMIAQESRQYQTIVKPPVRIVKPKGITNSHRPQYNIDSEELSLDDFFEATTTRKTTAKDYKQSYKVRTKEGMIRDAVLRALERKDHVGKFAQILPIIRAMSGNQRVALASLVASQVSTPPGRTPLNLAQVRSMFGNDANTTNDLMLPILLDMANLIRRAVRSGKEPREAKQPQPLPQPQMLRRSFTETEDTQLDDEPFELGDEQDTTTTKAPQTTQRNVLRNRRVRPQRADVHTKTNKQSTTIQNDVLDTKQNITNDTKVFNDTRDVTNNVSNSAVDDAKKNFTSSTTESTKASTTRSFRPANASRVVSDNTTHDLAADSTNQTLAQDLPVAEKLRAISKYIDRNGNLIRRGTYPPKQSPASRRTTAEPTLSPIRRRPIPARKLPTTVDQAKCELFTNTLCLHAEDYPTDAIMQSIRRNKAAAGALLADFRDPGEGAVDGVTADQEAKYTAEHYLVSNRRGDTANRDFASAGEAGFMCPSTVKYARPQRARATSGQWKYIVNTGEHTQTLRLEKCLKPKESCTYLTDNFKSKCVQVYNYHRLLTWDQQNGLHMDIFKVPTCCSCHIEGYSVSFPPLGHRTHETSAENFPGEELSSEHGNHAFEAVQSTVQRPSVTKNPPFSRNKPLESFPPFTDNQNIIAGSSFTNSKIADSDELSNIPPSSPMDSYGNTYFPDSFNQASSVRNVKRPISGRNPVGQSATGFDSATLPSYLEPPTPSAPSSFSFVKDIQNKYKFGQSQFKRGAVRPSRRPDRPIRKKISGAPDDLISSGTSAIEAHSNTEIETMEDFNDDLEESEVPKINANLNLSKRVTIAPKLHAAANDHSPTTVKPQGQSKTSNENDSFNGKRVNYNYHPIIDFFEEEDKDEDSSIDREDSMPAYIPTIESEWKPINHPPPRTIQATNLVSRKKHK